MHIRAVLMALVAVLVAGAAFTGFHAFDREPAIAAGPLVEALKDAHTPRDSGANLDEVYDRFVANTLSVDDRVPLLEAEGFACGISASERLPDNRILTCDRPLEGSKFCEGFSYYVYQAADGEITERAGTNYFVRERNRDFGGWCRQNQARHESRAGR